MSKTADSAIKIVCRLTLGVFAIALIGATLIAMFPGNAWWIRIFDFPRIQISALIVVALVGYGWLYLQRGLGPSGYVLAGVGALALALQLYFIVPYTPLHPTQMQQSLAENDDNRISMLKKRKVEREDSDVRDVGDEEESEEAIEEGTDRG